MRKLIVATRRLLGRSKLAVRFALFLHRQSNWIIRHHLGEESDFRINGESRLIAEVAPFCSSFVDVGANRGDWAANFLECMRTGGRGLLLDAAPAAISFLRERFAGEPRVEIIHSAVGDRTGEIEFCAEPLIGETSSVISSFSAPTSQRLVVPMTTVEAELARRNWDGSDYLKVDVEGYDLHALRGAGRFLTKGKFGIVQFEYNVPWVDAGSTLAAALSLLQAARYRVFLLRASGLSEFNYARYGEYFGYSNFVAFAPEWLDRTKSALTIETA